MADQADHFARRDIDADAAIDGAVAVAETDIAQFDAPFDLLQMQPAAPAPARWRHGRGCRKCAWRADADFCVTETMRLIESRRP